MQIPFKKHDWIASVQSLPKRPVAELESKESIAAENNVTEAFGVKKRESEVKILN